MDVFIVLWSCLFTTKLSCLQKKTLVTLRVKQGSKDLNSCTWHSLSSRKKNDTEHWTQSDPVDQTNDVYKWKKKWVYVFLFFTNACVFPYFCIWNFFDFCSTELWMPHRYLVKTHLKVKIRKLFQKEFSPHCVSFKNNNSIGYIEPGKMQTQKNVHSSKSRYN